MPCARCGHDRANHEDDNDGSCSYYSDWWKKYCPCTGFVEPDPPEKEEPVRHYCDDCDATVDNVGMHNADHTIRRVP